MSLEEMRLEALKAALTYAGPISSPEQIISSAETFYLFLLGGEGSSRYEDIPHINSESHL